MSLQTVRSADGTRLAVEVAGRGPSLILVGGAFGDRHAATSGTPLAAHLARRFTVFSYDRRGRGDSDLAPVDAPAREIEDLGAVLGLAGRGAAVFGNSAGGLLAVDAAAAGLPIESLVLFIPPVVLDVERARELTALAGRIDEAAREGRRSEAAQTFLTKVIEMPDHVVAGMRASPSWPGLERLAHTLGDDVRLVARGPDRLEVARSVRVPAVVLSPGVGPEAPRTLARTLAETMGRGRHRVLEGQSHAPQPSALARAIEDALG